MLKDTLSEIDRAYLAGIFDGEGCVGYYKRPNSTRCKYSYVATVLIAQSDPRLMTWLMDKIGFGTVYKKLAPKARRMGYMWETNRRDHVIEFLETIQPYLLVKADQVDILLTHLRLEGAAPMRKGTVTPEIVAAREETRVELKRLKNTYVISELTH